MSGPRLAYVVGRLDRVLGRALNEGVREHGLTAQQYVMLTILRSRPGLSNAQLARRSLTTPQSMNEVLLALEAKGYVRRRPDDAHGRIRRAELTQAGDRAAASCDPIVDELERRMTQDLEPSERDALLEHLKRCVRALGGGLPDT